MGMAWPGGGGAVEGLWAGEDAVAEVALLVCDAWMAEVRSALTV